MKKEFITSGPGLSICCWHICSAGSVADLDFAFKFEMF